MCQERWNEERKGRYFCQIQRVTRIGNGLRREETVLTRLRPGQCISNKTLKLEGRSTTCFCEDCEEEGSVDHVVLNCRQGEEHILYRCVYFLTQQVLRNYLKELQ